MSCIFQGISEVHEALSLRDIVWRFYFIFISVWTTLTFLLEVCEFTGNCLPTFFRPPLELMECSLLLKCIKTCELPYDMAMILFLNLYFFNLYCCMSVDLTYVFKCNNNILLTMVVTNWPEVKCRKKLTTSKQQRSISYGQRPRAYSTISWYDMICDEDGHL